MSIQSPNRRLARRLFIIFGAVSLLSLQTPSGASFAELQEAGNYSVLGLGKPAEDALGGAGSVDLASAKVIGDVGIGAYGILDFEGPATIDGDLYLDPLIKSVNTASGDITGSIINQDLGAAVADALDAASYYASLPPDETFGKIDTSTVIYGNGGVKVIEIAAIELAGRESLRFVGGTSDVYVVNLIGGFDLLNEAWISAVPPGNLLINVAGGGTSSPVTSSVGSVINGTILAATRKVFLQGRSGPVIGGQLAEISLNSGAEVRAEPFPVFPEPRDLTGDGKADILLRNTANGYLYMWAMDGNLKTYYGISALPLNHQVVGIGDLSGDGNADIVLRNTATGYLYMWEMNGNLKTYYGIGALPLDREVVGLGDLTGDGMADILLRNTVTGYLYMWAMDGNLKTYYGISALPLNREVVGIADLSGDGKADIVLRNADTGYLYLWEMDGNLKTYYGIGALPLDREVVGLGDLTGDGRADILLRNTATGYLFMWAMDGNLKTYYGISALPLNRKVVELGDLSGDGKADIVLRNTDTGYLYLWAMDGNLKTYYGIGPLALDREVQPATAAEPPPVVAAVDDISTTVSDKAAIISVLANDLPSPAALYVISLSQPANGVAVKNSDGTLSYAQNGLAKESVGMGLYKTYCKLCHNAAGFSGTDTFSYVASDGLSNDTATVTVTVNSFDPPGPFDSGGNISGWPMDACADLPHSCKAPGDAEIQAIGRFLSEGFWP